MSHPDIRPATTADIPDILRLVQDLAAYEKEPDAVEATEEDFTAALFPSKGEPTAYCHVAEAGDGKERHVAGIALWFLTFSTWTGKNGMHLEDLFVEPRHRGSGLGKALITELARECRERGFRRLEWTVLRWNAPSIAFYESIGATPQTEWETYRLDGSGLDL
ncbi:GNAT family N-acetyltransferase [Janibacter limosus]|uniref:GNAT family N-acetyltransferase n=1 Tax=Janibacter limosus TaxID=53458 RepID=UPI00082BAB23|nr:GNAT family N-acetyltransferase [Janibacter limosus]